MRYLPTLDIWDLSISTALRNGQLKLQTGQWLTCGRDNSKKCRFVSASKNNIYVIHWQGSSKSTNDCFRDTVKALKKHKKIKNLKKYLTIPKFCTIINYKEKQSKVKNGHNK